MTDDRHRDFLGHFLRHQRELCAFALARGVPPGEVDDLMQDAAALLWRKFNDYEAGSNFRAWAFRVIRFMVLQRHDRQRRQRRVLQLDPDTERALEALECDEHDHSLDLPVEQLHRCLAKLGAQARELIHLRYHEGLEPGAIAERMGLSAGSMRVRLHRIRQQLLACIRSHQEVGT